jgi:Ca2+-binding RTX toxin-like protein
MALIRGTELYDYLPGTEDDDTIKGFGGADSLYGAGGNDTLIGGRGEDYLDGGEGNDILDGGTLNDSYVPKWWEDWDTVGFNGATKGVVVDLKSGVAHDGSGGIDTLIDIESVYGTQFDDRLLGGNAANDDMEFFSGGVGDDYINGRSGFDIADYSSGIPSDRGIVVDLAAGTVKDPWRDTDTLVGVEGIWATSHDDRLYGSDADETFWTGDGYDLINGRGGLDTISYTIDRPMAERPHGIDADLARGTIFDMKYYIDFITSIENVTGSRLNDDIRGDDGANVLDGYLGDDLIKGRAGDDTLRGDLGNDHLDASNGNDHLDGGVGNDMLRGGAGSDTFIFAKDCDEDHILDFRTGLDKIDVSAFGFASKADVLDGFRILSPGAAILDLGGDNYVIFDYVNTGGVVPVLSAGDIII